VDDLSGLDRLDRWLNTRHGWSRFWLSWLKGFVGCYFAGLSGGAVWNLVGSPPLILFPAIVAAAAILAVPVGRLAAAAYSWRAARRPDKALPEYIWRWFAVSLLIALNATIQIVGLSGDLPVQHAVRLDLDAVSGVAVIATLALLITMVNYTSRITRARRAAYEPSPADPRPWH
jgi:hypothetical protein